VLTRKFSFLYVFFSFLLKKLTKSCRNFCENFHKKFHFHERLRKKFHSECGSGSRSHLNGYTDPKFFVKTIQGTKNFSHKLLRKQTFSRKLSQKRIFSRKLSRKQKCLQNKISSKVSEFSLIFAFRKNGKGGFRFNPIGFQS
jgi:hypothetical protein